MWGLIIWILLFFVLVLIHEFGHFLAAKKSGVNVLEFGIGIPPKVCTLFKDKSGTKYTLNALPFGWFVRLKWEDPKDEESFHAPDSFVKARLDKKVIILLAWVFMNFIAAWALFTFVFTQGTQPISILPENAVVSTSNSYLMPTLSFLKEEWFLQWEIQDNPALIDEVFDGSLGKEMWLMSGDIVIDINWEAVNAWTIGSILKKNIWSKIDLNIDRNGLPIYSSTVCPEDHCILGIALHTTNDLSIAKIQYPFKEAIFVWLKEIWAQTSLTLNVLWNLGKNLLSFNKDRIQWSLNKLTWPAWAIKFGEILLTEWGWVVFLAFAGMISLALAIFNILPIPALDGWRLIGVLFQKIFKLHPEKYFSIEWYINLIFFVLLLWLGIYVLLKDLVRFWDVSIPFMG